MPLEAARLIEKSWIGNDIALNQTILKFARTAKRHKPQGKTITNQTRPTASNALGYCGNAVEVQYGSVFWSIIWLIQRMYHFLCRYYI